MTIDPYMAGLVTALSLFSGAASYLQGRRDGRLQRGWLDASAELLTAPVAGWSALFLGLWQEWPEPLMCLCVLISAHHGGAIMATLLAALLSRINKLLKV